MAKIEINNSTDCVNAVARFYSKYDNELTAYKIDANHFHIHDDIKLHQESMIWLFSNIINSNASSSLIEDANQILDYLNTAHEKDARLIAYCKELYAFLIKMITDSVTIDNVKDVLDKMFLTIEGRVTSYKGNEYKQYEAVATHKQYRGNYTFGGSISSSDIVTSLYRVAEDITKAAYTLNGGTTEYNTYEFITLCQEHS